MGEQINQGETIMKIKLNDIGRGWGMLGNDAIETDTIEKYWRNTERSLSGNLYYLFLETNTRIYTTFNKSKNEIDKMVEKLDEVLKR